MLLYHHHLPVSAFVMPLIMKMIAHGGSNGVMSRIRCARTQLGDGPAEACWVFVGVLSELQR